MGDTFFLASGELQLRRKRKALSSPCPPVFWQQSLRVSCATGCGFPPLIRLEDLEDQLAQRVTILISLQTSSLFLVQPLFLRLVRFTRCFVT